MVPDFRRERLGVPSLSREVRAEPSTSLVTRSESPAPTFVRWALIESGGVMLRPMPLRRGEPERLETKGVEISPLDLRLLIEGGGVMERVMPRAGLLPAFDGGESNADSPPILARWLDIDEGGVMLRVIPLDARPTFKELILEAVALTLVR